ncbi:hypothetical protein B7494_g1815 [Chlorociboria aeruginascens]|nr:hypothetical protein B7494_g1815 [Chlorociboria aeruginascens]
MMAARAEIVVAFDLYGTLLSTESIARELAGYFGSERADSIAALWRRYQLEYTFRMNSMALYKPFSEITDKSLRHALAEHAVSLSDSDIESLMRAYDSLDTFPDVEPGLKDMASDPSIHAYVFSNGTDAMVGSSVKQSPSLSPYSSVFRDLVTTQEIEAFKPDPKVYRYLAKRVGKTTSRQDMSTIWLVSGNPFDCVGAKAAGMQCCWIDRAGGHHGKGGWTDRLGDLASGGPTLMVQGVDEAIDAIRSLAYLSLQARFSQHCVEEESLETLERRAAANNSGTGYTAPWRPQVHFTAPEYWLNDPNGLFKDEDGLWHMYYQYIDTITPGNDKDWGHATSQDLYTWINQPIAIAHSANGSIWSGSIVIDVNNTSGYFPKQSNGIVAFFTNWTPAEEAQYVAFSYDGGYTFTQYANNPIITLNMHGFRDPKVIWHAKTQKWVMVVSHADEQYIAFYTSSNLLNWTEVSTYSNTAINSVFECPQFLPIPFQHGSFVADAQNDTTNELEYYVLVISLGGGGPSGTSTVKYFPGTFNGTHFAPVDDSTSRVFDFGQDNYATAFYYNLHAPEDPRPVSTSWAVGLSYATTVPTGTEEGWLSAMSVARTHYLANITSQGYDLISQPYDITPMYERQISSEQNLGDGGIVVDYSSIYSGAISFSLLVRSSTLSASNTSVLMEFSSSVSGENVSLSFDVVSSPSTDSGAFGASFEMSRANIVPWTSSQIFPTFSLSNLVPYASEIQGTSGRLETYQVNGIIDRTILEAYLNGGVNAGTMIFFPSEKLDTLSLKISGVGKQGGVDFEAWGLTSGWSGTAADTKRSTALDMKIDL